MRQFEDVFAELTFVEAKRQSLDITMEDVQKFFGKFITLTTSEGAQAKKFKYEGFDIAAAEAWTGLLRQLDILFIELMTIEIEQRHDFKPEKETLQGFLNTVEALHAQAVSGATQKRVKQGA